MKSVIFLVFLAVLFVMHPVHADNIAEVNELSTGPEPAMTNVSYMLAKID